MPCRVGDDDRLSWLSPHDCRADRVSDTPRDAYRARACQPARNDINMSSLKHPDKYRADDPDRKFLQSREWRERIRPRQLGNQPACEHCLLMGYVAIAESVDHIIRPKGDYVLQRSSDNFVSLCNVHHQQKSLWERRSDGKPLVLGYDKDGWPVTIDPLDGTTAEAKAKKIKAGAGVKVF